MAPGNRAGAPCPRPAPGGAYTVWTHKQAPPVPPGPADTRPRRRGRTPGVGETFQLTAELAEAYEAHFVPAFFAQWAPPLLDAAGVASGQRVLDVACGTGIVARTAAGRVGPGGAVTGLDLNEAMLAVARRIRPDLTWRQGDAAALPFESGTFDAVLSQMALMFFPDPAGALREMARVARSGGAVAVLIPAGTDRNPPYQRFEDIVARHAGPAGASPGEHLLRPRRPGPAGGPLRRHRPAEGAGHQPHRGVPLRQHRPGGAGGAGQHPPRRAPGNRRTGADLRTAGWPSPPTRPRRAWRSPSRPSSWWGTPHNRMRGEQNGHEPGRPARRTAIRGDRGKAGRPRSTVCRGHLRWMRAARGPEGRPHNCCEGPQDVARTASPDETSSSSGGLRPPCPCAGAP